jgi:O-antigen/teichoic acid export membrane protein
MSILSPRLFRKAFAFVMSFGLAKGTAFLAALALPRLIDAQAYGLIELAMTVGLLAVAVLGLGVPAAAARLDLVDRDPRASSVLVALCLWLAAVGLLATGVMAASGHEARYICCAAILGLYALQFSASTYTRMRGHIQFSGWFDNVTILLAFLLVLGLVVVGRGDIQSFAWSLVTVSLAIAMGALALLARTSLAGFGGLLWSTVGIGIPMMFLGLANQVIFGTSRIAIAQELSLADVASFSLCARLTLILVFVSQVLSTGFFRSLYQLDNNAIARIFPKWLMALSGVALVLAATAYFSAHLLVIGTDIPAASLAAIFPAVTIQTTLWILNSNLEMYVTRELIARQVAIVFVVIAAAGLALGVVVSALGQLDLMAIINIYSLVMLIALLAQMVILSRRGISFGSSYRLLPMVAAPWLLLLLPRAA